MNNKKGQGDVMVWFIPLLIGLIAISIIVPMVTNKVSSTAVTDYTFTASNSTCVDITDLCITGTPTYENATNGAQTINAGNFSICSANDKADGVILKANADHKWNTQSVNATFSKLDCNPVSGTTGTIITYLPLLFAVLLLVFVAGFIRGGY